MVEMEIFIRDSLKEISKRCSLCPRWNVGAAHSAALLAGEVDVLELVYLCKRVCGSRKVGTEYDMKKPNGQRYNKYINSLDSVLI